MHKSLRDHFRGCLLGLAAGDALGAPVALMDAMTIRRKYGRLTEMIGGGRFKLKPGYFGDDTRMTLCVAESLVTRRVFDPDDIATRLVEWLESSPPNVGNHTRAVLSRMARGADWQTASYAVQRNHPAAASNGAVVRSTPLALFDFKSKAARIEHSRVQSEITHAHQECQWSCAFVTSFLVHAMTTGIRDAALDRAIAECSDAPGHIRKRVVTAPGKSRIELSPTKYVLDTVDCALWALMNTSSLEEAVEEAVALGGETSTIGALCGAMAGAFYGVDDIPSRWLDVLQDRERIAVLASTLADWQGV